MSSHALTWMLALAITTSVSHAQPRAAGDARPPVPTRQITVGPADADVVGRTNRAIQIAIDALAQRGGGVVRVLPGEYVCVDSVRLRPNITLLGDREKTILRRGPLVWSHLAVDAAQSQQRITPSDTRGFEPGISVCTYDEKSGWAHTAHPKRIVAIHDGVLYLDDFLTEDRWAERGGRVVNHFPMIVGHEAHNAVVDGLTVDSRVVGPDEQVKGIRTASVYLWRCRDTTLRNLTVTGGVGDGICFAKASVGATVEDCEVADHGYFGIHPGSYSKDSTVRRCRVHDNAYDGLYICWGISNSSFTDNHIYRNGWGRFRGGVSIGHQDTDNLIARNHIHDNAKYGIGFRMETLPNGAHRVTIRENVIENNGSRPDQLQDIKVRLQPFELIGAGISIAGVTHGTVIEKNIFRDTRHGDERTQWHAVVRLNGVEDMLFKDNVVESLPGEPVLDMSRKAPAAAP